MKTRNALGKLHSSERAGQKMNPGGPCRSPSKGDSLITVQQFPYALVQSLIVKRISDYIFVEWLKAIISYGLLQVALSSILSTYTHALLLDYYYVLVCFRTLSTFTSSGMIIGVPNVHEGSYFPQENSTNEGQI